MIIFNAEPVISHTMTRTLATTHCTTSHFLRMIRWCCLWLGALSAALPLTAKQSEGDTAEGKKLFLTYCAACHTRNMKDDLTGPALGGVEERWADYSREDLYAYIRSTQTALADEHPRAVQLWEEWEPTLMSDFDLTDKQIESILAYIEQVYKGTYEQPASAIDSPGPPPTADPLVINLPLGRNKSQLGSHEAALQNGSIAYTWPEKMVVGKVERIIVRIVRGDVNDPDASVSAEAFSAHPAGGDDLVLDALEIGDIMTVELFNPEEDPDDPFFYINSYEPEDLAGRKQIEATQFAEWNFSVKALRKGQAPLKLVAYIREDSNSGSRERPVFEAAIHIVAAQRQLQIPFFYLVGAIGMVAIAWSFRQLRMTTRMRRQIMALPSLSEQQQGRIRELLKKDQLEQALDLLADYLAGSEQQKEIDLLIARTERLKWEKRNNLITEDAAGVGRSKLLQAVMELVG